MQICKADNDSQLSYKGVDLFLPDFQPVSLQELVAHSDAVPTV